MVFLPRDPQRRLRCEELCVRICAEEGHRALGWRDVPVAVEAAGPVARATAPVVRQLLVERRAGDQPSFELLRYGIPDFKLEKWLIDRRVEQLEAEGVRFRLGCAVSGDLRGEYETVVLATGAQRQRDLDVPGRGLTGVELAMPYLTGRNRSVAGGGMAPVTASGKRVVVLGGGDTSADCLGCALREQAASVVEIAHGPRPARPPSHPAHEEGGERAWQFETARFTGRAGTVTGLTSTTGETVPADLVLLAIGFAGVEADPVYAAHGAAIGPAGTVDPAGLPDAVFAAGDCVLGADLVVTAIAQGRRAAAAVERTLSLACSA